MGGYERKKGSLVARDIVNTEKKVGPFTKFGRNSQNDPSLNGFNAEKVSKNRKIFLERMHETSPSVKQCKPDVASEVKVGIEYLNTTADDLKDNKQIESFVELAKQAGKSCEEVIARLRYLNVPEDLIKYAENHYKENENNYRMEISEQDIREQN